ncbi:kinetochore protein Nuf2 [Kwoniella heveanensis CBS 569]|nr:kinetochore protein Nuf2 [Kwoniella heveanensis CBS 569]
MSQQQGRGRAAIQPVPPFPLMTAMEVMDCLHALGVNAQIEDLTKPNAATAQHVYAQLLDALMAAPMEAIEGPKATLLGMMEYKELYNDALHFTMFYRHCRTLAELCGINDFAISDLTRPDAQRFRTCLSGIMNFAKFRDERMHFQNQLQASVQEQADRGLELRRKLAHVEAQIEEIKARNAAEQPQFEQAQKRNEGLRSELLELRAQQVKLSQEVEELKRERQALMDQAAHNAHLNTQLSQQILSTKSRLVQSPDRIKRQISEMHSAVSHEKSKLASFQVKARELANRLEVIGSLENDLKGLIDLEKGILEQKAKVEEHRRSKTLLESKKEGREIELASLVEKTKQLQTQFSNAQDKLARQNVMRDELQKKGMQRIEELKAEYKVRSKERGEWQKQRDVLLAEQKELESEMAAFLAAHDEEINGMLEEYWNMRRQAEEYMNTMTHRLGLQLRG